MSVLQYKRCMYRRAVVSYHSLFLLICSYLLGLYLVQCTEGKVRDLVYCVWPRIHAWLLNTEKRFAHAEEISSRFHEVPTSKKKIRSLQRTPAQIAPEAHDEQQNFFSSMCLISSPINQEPTLTSSCA